MKEEFFDEKPMNFKFELFDSQMFSLECRRDFETELEKFLYKLKIPLTVV